MRLLRNLQHIFRYLIRKPLTDGIKTAATHFEKANKTGNIYVSKSNNENIIRLAPIALFVFRRVDHLRKTVDALKANELADKSLLYIFCDGPRTASDNAGVRAVREYVRSISGFAEIKIIERGANLGLANSIIMGVTDLLTIHKKIIVIEDDLVTSKYFLKFMNDGLAAYESTEAVASIHGYLYPVTEELPNTFFLRGADCWGWATWQRAWSKFQPNAEVLLEKLKIQNLEREFNLDNSYDFIGMLSASAEGKVDSWAIRWHASTFLENMLTLYPGNSLVHNIGLDDSGTHCVATDKFVVELADHAIELNNIQIKESYEARHALIRFYSRQHSNISDRA